MLDLAGLLERGHGRGYLAALELGGPASAEVLRCVIEDPRFDPQIESRAHYYADLLIALGSCPVQPIVDALDRRERENAWLAHDVLIQLAWRGHFGALAAVIDKVRARTLAADALDDIGGRALVERVFALAGRAPPPKPEPRHPSRPRLTLAPSLGIEQLVALATGADKLDKVIAARRLGELDHPALVPDAEAFLRSECGVAFEHRRHGACQRRAWVVYLEALSPIHTLPLARRWFHAEWPLSLAAEAILVRHAEPDDRSMLEDAGARALAERQVYRLCSVVDALAGLADVRSLPLLATIYGETRYSYARERVCIALLDHADHADAQALLRESLWDCESYARAIACEAVDPTIAAARLRELESDAFERDEVRDAARAALESSA